MKVYSNMMWIWKNVRGGYAGADGTIREYGITHFIIEKKGKLRTMCGKAKLPENPELVEYKDRVANASCWHCFRCRFGHNAAMRYAKR